MGIYYDNKIYGVGWELYDEDEINIVRHFEKKYENEMTMEQIQECKVEYDKFTDIEKENSKFYVIVSFSSTYEINNDKYYVPYRFYKNRLEQFFLNGHDKNIC